jgi:REP element-mobilizing transposase RayT
MARPLRINVAGGWYHITARGHNRQRIYCDREDYGHFMELLGAMSERFRVHVHAYSLMPNHYHLLISTPAGNASRAMQWLNVSYGVWYNLTHDRTGSVFQGRFGSVLVEGGAWGLEVSAYIHMNPIVMSSKGFGKRDRAAERLGWKKPEKEEVERRLADIRTFEWSSYRAYGGYSRKPDWLETGRLLSRVKDGEAGYRRFIEERIRQGVEENIMSKVKWGLVLGGERFARKVRGRVKINRESMGRRELKKQMSFEGIIKALERIKGEAWDDFRDRHGDPGRDLALWCGRRYAGLTLKELGRKVGGLDYSGVSRAIDRVDIRAKTDRRLRKTMTRLAAICQK